MIVGRGTGRRAAMTHRPVLFAILAMLSGGLAAPPAHAATAPKRASPQEVSRGLYAAWKAGDRRAARRIAAPQAVAKLFAVRWRALQAKGCALRDEGGFQCVYRDAALDFSVAMDVEGGASVGGYNVVGVSFSSEE